MERSGMRNLKMPDAVTRLPVKHRQRVIACDHLPWLSKDFNSLIFHIDTELCIFKKIQS